MIKLGAKVKDNVTGFESVVVARAEYLSGCVRYEVVALNDPGKEYWFDEDRLGPSTDEPSGFHDALPSRDP